MAGFLSLPLRTSRLLLRPYRPEDAPALFSIFSDPLVMRYWSTPPWASIEQAHRTIEGDIKSLESGQQLRLGIERIDDSTLIGQCTLFNIAPSCRRAEIGYCLASAAWGRGYMCEALQELVRYGFLELDLHRIEADIDPRNAASERLLRRLGFVEEGLLRERWIVNGEISDSCFFGLLRTEWVASRDNTSGGA
jgi:RimJ/RimL family protein N-acetyltransferase